MMKGIEKRWICSVQVHGVDSIGLCRARIQLAVDWSEHGAKLVSGRATVLVDSRWTDETAVEVQEAVELFQEYVSAKSLTSRWTVTYSPGVDGAFANRELGFSPAKPINWASPPQSVNFEVPELSELTVSCDLVVE